jgi:hypothetical protein
MADLRVFGKTPKGTTELTARSGALSLAQRRLLILVDGVRDVEQLAELVPSAIGESLAVLEAGGFVALLGGAAESADTVQGAADTVQGVATAIPEAEMTTVHEAKARAVRAINDLLGPAADGLAMAIEAATSGDELRPLIREAQRLVAVAHGAATAQAFIVGVRRR